VSPSVRLHGKGNKFRTCPLWSTTVTSLPCLVGNRNKTDAVFWNRVKPLTRFGIHRVVTQYADLASKSISLLTAKLVSSHTIRHRTAVHLLRAGVDISTIRAWLGHVSLDTTHIYAEVDMEMEARLAEAIGPTLAGKTDRQKNPHPPRSLAWLAWIVARLSC
jgi:integrase/recombinase XerD